MQPNERTRDVYEQIDVYPKPPLPPLPDPADPDLFKNIGVKPDRFTQGLLHATARITGFKKFLETLPDHIEEYMRTYDTRSSALYGPVVSASLALKDDARTNDPLDRAVSLIIGVRRLRDKVMSGTLPPDKHRGQVLEMGQYPNYFGACQIIENSRTSIFKTNEVGKINVLYKGRFFIIDIGENFDDWNPDQLKVTLKKIIETADNEKSLEKTQSPTLLSAAGPRTQLRAFTRMQQNPDNKISISRLKHSLFTLCLDLENKPETYADAALIAQGQNYDNRWWHASLQVAVYGNARVAAICNFSTYIDGNTMARGVREIYSESVNSPLPKGESVEKTGLLPFTRLKWRVPEPGLARAENEIKAVKDDQQATFEIDSVGRDFFTKHKVDAVSCFVLALQMTVLKLTGTMGRISQFLAMSKYRCMDLLKTVVTTREVEQFTEYMTADNPDHKTAQKLLHEAIASQKAALRERRKCIPVYELISYFLQSRHGLSKIFVLAVGGLATFLLRALGRFEMKQREILISHPVIYEEIPVFGRPGVRLPYLKYFGLHYQIMEDKTVITMMPSANWQVSNADLISELEKNLNVIKDIIAAKQEANGS